ncbi:phage portal protein [Anaerofustis stercorihominis]|uniref:phage portal protein n=1 Tax=Anaerofustis stercorihominis TaxID=214853 RepID=UPI002672421B|nr:phage portal protein [Anaerofustis stercorihominis]
MGFWDKIFGKTKDNKKKYDYVRMLDGSIPIFSQFGDDIYASDVVQQAVKCIVDEMIKLKPRHVVYSNSSELSTMMNSPEQKVLDNPNELMTTAEFIEKVIWLYEGYYNCYIYPIRDENGVIKEMYPLERPRAEFLNDGIGRLYIKFTFETGYDFTCLYSDIIHLRKDYSENAFAGGDSQGNPDNGPLLKTLNLYDSMLQSIDKGIKTSYSINGILKTSTILDEDLTDKRIKEFEAKLKNNTSGIIPTGLDGDYIPLKKDAKIIDKDLLEFIDSKILRHYGVSYPILTGDYTKEQYTAFYQKTLEPLIIKLSQCFTKNFFQGRRYSFGNKIQFFAEDLVFMDNNQILEFANIVGGRGALTNGKLLSLFKLDPALAGETMNKRYMSLNFVDVDIANQYQMQEKNSNINILNGKSENKDNNSEKNTDEDIKENEGDSEIKEDEQSKDNKS